MNISFACPSCNMSHNINEDLVPREGRNVKCKCGHRFLLHPPEDDIDQDCLDLSSIDSNDNNNYIDDRSGYVYILINPSLQGMVKVGKTTRSPEERANELSNTSMPTPFIVAYDVYVKDCHIAEEILHALLEENGYRVSDNREFFNAPLKEIIVLMESVKKQIGTIQPNNKCVSQQKYNNINDDYDHNLIDNIMNQAFDYYNGSNDKLEDESKALDLFKKAARLGSGISGYMAGKIYYYSDIVKKDVNSSIKYYTIGAEIKNSFSRECYQTLAAIYRIDIIVPNNCKKCWEKCIEHAKHDTISLGEADTYHIGKPYPYAQYIMHMFELNLPIDEKIISDMNHCTQCLTQIYEILLDVKKEADMWESRYNQRPSNIFVNADALQKSLDFMRKYI